MTDFRRIVLLAQNEIVRRIRNRSAIVTAFVGPLALAIIFSVLVGGATSPSLTIGVADEDDSSARRAIVAELLSPDAGGQGGDAPSFVAVESGDLARDGVDTDDLDAAVVLPDGFLAGVQQGVPPTLTVLRSPERPIAGQVAESVAREIALRVQGVALAERTIALAGGPAGASQRPPEAAERPEAFSLVELERGGSELSTPAYYGASFSVLFLFFTVSFAARSLLAERESGTLARILATPARASSIVVGKILAVSVLGLAGFLTVWLVTSLVFGADWGNPLGVLLVMLATVAALAGVATFIASLAKTERQADAFTSIVTFAFALIGGNFVQPGQGPALLDTLSLLTPNGWSLRAFTDLSADASTVASVLGSLGVLVAIGLLFGAAGLARVRRVFAA